MNTFEALMWVAEMVAKAQHGVEPRFVGTGAEVLEGWYLAEEPINGFFI